MPHNFIAFFFVIALSFLRGLFVSCKAPKRAMHKTDGDLMESTTGTNQMKADRQNNQLTDGNKYDGGENAC